MDCRILNAVPLLFKYCGTGIFNEVKDLNSSSLKIDPLKEKIAGAWVCFRLCILVCKGRYSTMMS